MNAASDSLSFEDWPICDPAGSTSLSPAHNAAQLHPKCIAHDVIYPRRAIIFLDGQLPRGVFLLQKGRVKLSISDASGRGLISKIAFPGDVLGLHSVITGNPYDTSAETLEPSRLKFIAAADFIRFLSQHGDACLRVVRLVSRDYAASYRLVRSIALAHSASQKLAALLLDGSPERRLDGQDILAKLTHEDIAQLIGVSRETVTRLLGEFRRRRVLDLAGSSLHIHNRLALEKIAASLSGAV